MADAEKQRAALRRLIETMDYATVTFDTLPGDESVEAALEFGEAYIEACEALGMDLPGHIAIKPELATAVR